MIRVADKREIKCKVIQFALYFLNNFVVLVTVLLAFLMELKMNGKKISSYLGKKFCVLEYSFLLEERKSTVYLHGKNRDYVTLHLHFFSYLSIFSYYLFISKESICQKIWN